MNEICTTACVFWMVLLFSSIALATSTGPNTTPDHDVAVTNVSVPSSCDRGDTVPVKVSVANQGAHREAFRVILTDQTGGKQIASKEVTLAKGWKDGSEDVADVVFNGEEEGIQNFGDGIWSRGDVNGDGFDDILICAPRWNNSRGRVYLYYGGSGIDPSCPDVTFSGEDPNTNLGDYAGISSCDVNMDGYDDVIIGAWGYHDYDGLVYVYYGGPKMDTQADMVFYGETGQKSAFGLTVTAGDIDNDGYEDIIVGAQNYDHGRGRVYLFWGGNPMDTTADLIFDGEAAGDWFGRKIDARGDVNGDGYNDILIGARQWGGDKRGRAYLFFGGTRTNIDTVRDRIFTGENVNDEMGSSVGIFDIDNDGCSDVIVGARFARNWRGVVYLWWGEKDLSSNRQADIVLEGEQRSHIGGDEIACGYFNNDEYGDILAGALGYPDPHYTENRMGRAYIFNGDTRASMDHLADHVFGGESGHSGRFGCGLSSGDFNNDNYDDVVIGAWGYNNLQGRAYLYYGPFSDTTDITFNWDTSNTLIGEHRLKVEISPVPGEKDTADNVVAKTINIKPKPVHDVAVTNVSVPSSCDQGDTVPVKVSVANQGAHREAFRVQLMDTTSSVEIAGKDVTLAKGWKDGSEDVADLIFDTETDEENEFSNSMDSSGDVNGDGCDDLLVNAGYWHGGQGRVYLYFGGRDIDNIADKVFSGEAVGDYFGDMAGTLGDINGDGFYDVIVGARGYNSSGDGWGDGRVYIYYGAPNMDNIADVILEGESGQRGCFGSDVKAGDVDNDGCDDLLVGACVMDSWRGKSYLFWGGKPFDRSADVVFEGENKNDWFGRQARVGGDVNGDGYNDIIIGAKHWDISGGDDKFGRAYLYYGNTQEKMNGTVDKVFSGETEKDQFSTALDLFDIDNDDFAEVVIGARFAADYHGRIYIYWGVNDFDGSSPDLILEVESGGNMGCGDISCGYFNDDGFGDIVAGAYNYPNQMAKRGRAYIFNGNTRASMDQLADHLFEGEFGQAGRFGSTTASSDFNDDNYDDIVIGAWGYNNRQGRAYLYYGPFENTADITLNWDTTKTSPGKHTLKVTIAPVDGKENMADNVLTATVNIKTP